MIIMKEVQGKMFNVSISKRIFATDAFVFMKQSMELTVLWYLNLQKGLDFKRRP